MLTRQKILLLLAIMVMVAAAAVLALLAATLLAANEPRGMTPYGWRKQYAERVGSTAVEGKP